MAARGHFPARRRRQWALQRLQTNLTPAGGGGKDAVDLLAQYRTRMGISHTQGMTVAAIRGALYPQFAAAPAVLDAQEVFVGITVVSQDAFASGASALPDPATDDADWVWHNWMYVPASSTSIVSAAWEGLRLDIHNKSMRKMEQANKTLVIVATNLNISGNDVTINVLGYTRTLLLLP